MKKHQLLMALALPLTLNAFSQQIKTSDVTKIPTDGDVIRAMQKQKDDGFFNVPEVEKKSYDTSKVKPVPKGTFKVDIDPPKAQKLAKPDPKKQSDLNELIDSFIKKKAPKELAQSDNDGKVKTVNDIAVFVSFSMPSHTLQEYARQAKIYGATLVLRGMKNESVDQTREAALLVNDALAPWEINPELFKAFKIDKVPAIVVASSQAGSVLDDGCSPEGTYASVFGEVSIEQALTIMADKAPKDIADIAKTSIAKVREKQKNN